VTIAQHRVRLQRPQSSVAAVEQREAASGCEAVASSTVEVYLKNRVTWFYDCCAAGRSLALLDSCYRVRCFKGIACP